MCSLKLELHTNTDTLQQSYTGSLLSCANRRWFLNESAAKKVKRHCSKCTNPLLWCVKGFTSITQLYPDHFHSRVKGNIFRPTRRTLCSFLRCLCIYSQHMYMHNNYLRGQLGLCCISSWIWLLPGQKKKYFPPKQNAIYTLIFCWTFFIFN